MTVVGSAVKIRLGDLEYDRHVVSVTVELGLLPTVDHAVVILPVAVEVRAAPGDPATIELTGPDGPQTVITGTVRSVGRGLDGTRVVLAGPGGLLAAARPAATYTGQDAAAIVRALASDAGVDIGTIELPADLPAYVADQSRTTAEHVAALAALMGAVAGFDSDGALQVGPPPPRPQQALRHGRELVAFTTTSGPQPALRLAVGAGGAASASAPGALRPSRSVIPAGAPAAGPGTVRVAAGVLRVAAAASLAQRGAETDAARATGRMRAECLLVPALRPGMAVEVQDLPGAQSGGPFMLTRVRHLVGPTGRAATQLTGDGGGPGDGAGGLLGAVAGAVGALL